ncbi:phosphoribosylamine--glycine ligase [Clostridia bacterium]|nr:phosphoribosylamine--glycine ligase [Clostridia bacterium]
MNKKDILVIGGGGREHALVWKLKQSKSAGKLYCIPGNAGIAEIAECRPELKATDFDGILNFLREHKNVYMTVVAPDDPLALGLVNTLNENGFRAFGPTAEAAILEASKVFSKNLMKKYGIPTAAFEVFSAQNAALEYLKTAKFPSVVKADGLALGKGVLICPTVSEAEEAVKNMMTEGKFGEAGKNIVIEEFIKGYEVSILAFCDGKTIVPMVSSQDHKRSHDGDKGLNTGGMGAFAPSVKFNKKLLPGIMKDIIMPTMEAMNQEKRPFKGVLYFGLMIDGGDVRVLEYNARFGDPETQSVLPLLKGDLLDIFDKIIDGKLADAKIAWEDKACLCVMLTSGGYPAKYETGKPVAAGDLDKDVILFHSGTRRGADGTLLTAGGRVLGVTAVADDLDAARKKVYANIKKITFDKMHYRTDI